MVSSPEGVPPSGEERDGTHKEAQDGRKYGDNQQELVAAAEAEAFVIGYKLGARMTQEALEGMDIPDIDEE